MQWIAMITMLIDHAGIVWFPDSPVWRIIGRAAFPIYTFFIARGMDLTRNKAKYMQRLFLLAVISQAPFMLLFDTWDMNVIGTLAISVGALYLMERMPAANALRFAWPAAAAVGMECLNSLCGIGFDYGAYGLLLLVIYRYARDRGVWLWHLALNFLYVALFLAPLQLFSILPSFWIAYGPASRTAARAVPRWLWRAFYPAHLAILYLLSLLTAPA